MFKGLTQALVSVAIVLCASPAFARLDEPASAPAPNSSIAVNTYPAADLILGDLALPVVGLAGSGGSLGLRRGAHEPAPGELNVFGSVAIPVATLATTRKWQAVIDSEMAAGPPTEDAARLLALVTDSNARTDVEVLALVNRVVNTAIRYTADRGDVWSTAIVTAARGTGDCEDYAILKHWLLVNLGFSAEQLQLVVLRDARRGLNHAVLAVHLASGSYILDNLTNRLMADAAFRSYVPLVSFVGDKSYVHGLGAQS